MSRKMKVKSENTVQRHCGLDPQSPCFFAGDSCFRRNDAVEDWNDGAIPLLSLEGLGEVKNQ